MEGDSCTGASRVFWETSNASEYIIALIRRSDVKLLHEPNRPRTQGFGPLFTTKLLISVA